MNEMLEAVREYVQRRVAEGFAGEEDIIEDAVEYLGDEFDGIDLEPLVRKVTRKSFAAHRKQQQMWAGPTDCDRLDAAFEALEGEGIVARQNFSCCMTCGTSEIGGEMRDAEESGPVEGYVFYHMQDTERACEGGNLWLAYGGTTGEDKETRAVGRRVRKALERQGLQVRWNGRADTRIEVVMEWKRRR